MSQKIIAYQGVPGAYSHQACRAIFPNYTYRGYKTFENAFQAIQTGEVQYGVIPVENSTAGPVVPVHNLLPGAGLEIIDQYALPIHHCLMVPHKAFEEYEDADAALSGIREVHSHPQALAQCSEFLNDNIPQANAVEVFDTAGAARDISGRSDCHVAAIASEVAADIYNMQIVRRNIEDCPSNTTHFVVLSL